LRQLAGRASVRAARLVAQSSLAESPERSMICSSTCCGVARSWAMPAKAFSTLVSRPVSCGALVCAAGSPDRM
jgi:hypothetical protein